VGLGARFVLVVKAHRAVGTKVVCVSSLGGVAAFDSVRAAASHNFTLAVHYQIDFFRSLMMVRPVRTPWRKIHPEKAVHYVRLINQVALSGVQSNQKFVQN